MGGTCSCGKEGDYEAIQRRNTTADLADFRQRQIGSVIGSLVADAAARPLHWIYEPIHPNLMSKTIKDMKDFGFFPENASPFYSLPTGKQSIYGDQLYATLLAMEKTKNFDIKIWKDVLYETFGGKENIYQTSRNLREKESPVIGPWIDQTLINFVENYEKKLEVYGLDEKDNDTIFNALPVVVLLAKKKIDTFPTNACVEIAKNMSINPLNIIRCLFILQLLWEILLNGEKYKNEKSFNFGQLIYDTKKKYLSNAVDYNKNVEIVEKEIDDVLNDNGIEINNNQIILNINKRKYKTQKECVAKYGPECTQPGSLKSSLYNILMNSDNNNNFKKLILDEIEAGGDGCSRSMIDALLYCAVYGQNCIPKDWIDKTDNAKNAIKICNKIY